MDEHAKAEERDRSPLWERIAIFAFGVTFVSVLLTLAFVFPYPTPMQYTISRIVLALSASAIATLITGFIVVEIPRVAKAGGALAVFLIVFFYSPAALVVNDLSAAERNMSDKQFDSAQHQLESVVNANPKNATVQNLLGHVLWKKQRPAEALEKFQSAAALADGHERDRYLFNAAAAELELGKYDDAARTLDDVLSRDPQDIATQYNLGIAKAQLGQYNAARSIFSHLYNVGEKAGTDYRPMAKLQLGLVAILQGRESGLDEAIPYFKDVIFLEQPFEKLFLQCSTVVNNEDFSLERRILDGIADTPAYRAFRHDISRGRDCPSSIPS